MVNKPVSHIQGIGTDIIEIERIQQAFDRHGDRFLDRIFTQKEKDYCLRYKFPIPHFAGRFAAKEAVLKALGSGLRGEISWIDLEILNDAFGKPEVYLTEKIRGIFCVESILLSISHCNSYATATAVVMG